MHKPLISILLLVAALAGCNGRVEDRLLRQIEETCSKSTKPGCLVKLKEITPFQWEKLYFFISWTTADSIRKAVGFNYQGDDVADDYTRMVFTRGNAVVHEEDFQSYDFHRSTISFSVQAKPLFFTPDNALFWVEKGKIQYACAQCYSYSLSVNK